MDARLGPRRRLIDVRATGARRAVREGLRVLVMAVAVAAALAYLMATHVMVEYHPVQTHRAFNDLGVVPLVALALVLALQLLARGTSYAAGVAVGIVTVVAAFGTTGLMTFTHMFTHVEGEAPSLLAVLFLTLLGGAQIVVEPLVAWRERQLLDRADPRLARATVRT